MAGLFAIVQLFFLTAILAANVPIRLPEHSEQTSYPANCPDANCNRKCAGRSRCNDHDNDGSACKNGNNACTCTTCNDGTHNNGENPRQDREANGRGAHGHSERRVPDRSCTTCPKNDGGRKCNSDSCDGANGGGINVQVCLTCRRDSGGNKDCNHGCDKNEGNSGRRDTNDKRECGSCAKDNGARGHGHHHG